MGKKLAAAAALAAILILTACSGSSSEPTSASTSTGASTSTTFDDHGVVFSYPSSWDPIPTEAKNVQAGTASWETGVGVSPVDLVMVAEYPIKVSIDSKNIDKAAASITSTISDLFRQGGGTMESGPTSSTMGGFPSLGFTGTIGTADGTQVSSRVTLAFNGTTEYFVNCQYTDAYQAEISDGCDQIVSTFQTT
jgi:hypothetical protein